MDLGEFGFLVFGSVCCFFLSVEVVFMGFYSVFFFCVVLDFLCGELGCRWLFTYYSWVWGLVGILGCVGSILVRFLGVFWRGCCFGVVCVGFRRLFFGFFVCLVWGLVGEFVWLRLLVVLGSGVYFVFGGRRRRREGFRVGGVNFIV